MIDELETDRWLAASPSARDDIARRLLRHLPDGWRVGAPLPAAHGTVPSFIWENVAFALVPGARRLGFDAAMWQATPEEAASFAETVEEYFAEPVAIQAFVAASTGRPRAVALDPFLCEVTARPSGTIVGADPIVHADLVARVAPDGFALPAADAWEAACAGGRATLFHWGDHAPMDRYPLASEGWHPSPNSFGLRIAQDTYRPDLLGVPGLARGGDGGCMICGGTGYFVAWLTLASAWHDADLSACTEIFGDNHRVRRIFRL